MACSLLRGFGRIKNLNPFDFFVCHGDLVWVSIVNSELGLCWILVMSQVHDSAVCLKRFCLNASALSWKMQIAFIGCSLYFVVKFFIREDRKGF